MENYHSHKTVISKYVAEDLVTDLIFVPASCTCIAHPMYVSVNRPFKAKLTRSLGGMEKGIKHVLIRDRIL